MVKLSNTSVPMRVSIKFDKTLKRLQKELSKSLGYNLTIRQVTEFLAENIKENNFNLKKSKPRLNNFGFIK